MADQPKEVPVNFIDNPHAPELFATDAAGIWIHEGVIHLSLEAARVDHGAMPGPINRVVVARLAMSVSGIQRLVHGLSTFLEKQGIGMPEVPADAKLH